MEAAKSIVIGRDILMAAITGWFLWKDVRDIASSVGSSATIFLSLSGVGLIW